MSRNTGKGSFCFLFFLALTAEGQARQIIIFI